MRKSSKVYVIEWKVQQSDGSVRSRYNAFTMGISRAEAKQIDICEKERAKESGEVLELVCFHERNSAVARRVGIA